MSPDQEQRRLSAILAADVAGYTRLVERDTEGTVAAWKAARDDVIHPAISGRSGRIVKLTGDGFLAEFSSVQDAVTCAMVIQRELSGSPLRFRMGISLGDVVDDGEDIHGEGVNIAARIEAFANPGDINISGMVFEAVRNRIAATFQDLGEHTVKHVSAAVRVYRIAVQERVSEVEESPGGLALPDKPSIAVLPFDNMSIDPEQEYFADGIVEDIITALSRNKWLFVIARNSSFTYKGKAVDVKQVGRELGVRYVLEGSVRKAANRVRITGQLIDASNGSHLWANRFDGEISDIFDLQDQVTQSVAGAIAPRLELAEIERAKRKPTGSLDAYDYYLRGMAAFHKFTRAANEQALSMFSRALERDPDFASAYGMAARSYTQRKGFGWITDSVHESSEAQRLARIALTLGQDDAIALAGAGFALVAFGEVADGNAFLDRALSVNPNLAWAWHTSGFAKALVGVPDSAVEHAAHAMRLSPQDPQIFAMQAVAALGHYFSGRYEEAFSWGEKALRDRSNFLLAAGVTAASAAMSDRQTDAEQAMLRVRELNPELCQSNLRDWLPFQRPEDCSRWAEGLRRAGLPE